MDEPFFYPSTVHIFFESDQPSRATWDALRALAVQWNANHRSQFIVDEEIRVTLSKGVVDPERQELEAALAKIKSVHGCRWREGAIPRYEGPAARATADFVDLIGSGAPAGFVANELEAFGAPALCEACGAHRGNRSRRLAAPIRINEHLLPRDAALDVVNLSNGGYLVSKRFAEELAAHGATGHALHSVLRDPDDVTSERYFLLVATTAIVGTCPTHTPMTRTPCPMCGNGGGDLLGNLHIEEGLLRGLDVFSRDRGGLSGLYIARGLYAHLTAKGMNIVTSTALDRCPHEPSPARINAAQSLVVPVPRVRAQRAHCSVDAFMHFVRSPRPNVTCTRRGHHNVDDVRTFEVAHMVEPGALAAELDALEVRMADVAHLRALALQADGICIFYQGARPAMFPTLEAIHATEGEVCVPAAIQFEKSCDWAALQRMVQEASAYLDAPFLGAHGAPFATIVGSSHRLVCADGRIYYFAPGGDGLHNQVVAESLSELLGIVTTSLARLLMDGPSVTTYFDEEGDQYYPRAFGVERR